MDYGNGNKAEQPQDAKELNKQHCCISLSSRGLRRHEYQTLLTETRYSPAPEECREKRGTCVMDEDVKMSIIIVDS
jgi:hypothetical protein